jgi:ABC-type multidrug transport system fused ATPase/permease subunit
VKRATALFLNQSFMVKTFYTETAQKHQIIVQTTEQQARQIAYLRLATMLTLLGVAYFFYQQQNWLVLVGACGILVVVFFILVVKHTNLKEKLRFHELLVTINQDELAYLSGDSTPFGDGKKFIDPEHPYTFDLDIFGESALFPALNRTTTVSGEQKLADLLSHPTQIEISEQQNAVKELAQKAEWRQTLQASGLMYASEKEQLARFNVWLDKPSDFGEKKLLRALTFVLPVVFCLIFVISFFINLPQSTTILKYLFGLNLLIVGFYLKNIKSEIELLTTVTASFERYSKLLQSIENQQFESKILRGVKSQISTDGTTASVAIKQLSRLLNRLEAVNPMVAIVLNGLMQYHLHALFDLAQWKQVHGKQIRTWFVAIAEMEVLASLGNWAFNHPEFVFPTENTEGGIRGQNVGHPLIPVAKCVGNDVNFSPTTFVILTGSNMSGKSTFLRTLGVNLVLAKAGAPVCAEQFSFQPYPIFISMRISDSLQNSESLFFAELKRLQRIVQQLESGQKTFVILDEILRGTNSNDKRAGTIGLIKKLLAQKAIGIIATHDLVVGDMTPQYPNALENKCFEVELAPEGLAFDYKLRSGVAQQMSAAYLMKKMKIVDEDK